MAIPRESGHRKPVDGAGPVAHGLNVGLGVAAVALGAATAVGVWLFNQAFGLVHQVVFDRVGAALPRSAR